MKDEKGFTLIEILVAISIMSILMLSLSQILNFNFYKLSENTRNYTYKLEARYAMSKIINEMKRNYSTYFDTGKVYAADASVLINTTPNETIGNLYYYYDANRYGIGDGYGELRGSDGRTIVENIKDLKIESINSDLVKVSIKTGRKNSEKSFQLVTYCKLYD